jgi:nucleoside-diphosphate-sugar epimerase
MRILIAGASGAIGPRLVRRLRANQHGVFALARSPDSAPALKEIGAEPVIADALDAAAVSKMESKPPHDAKVPINDPKHWRERAEEARTVADDLTDPESKRMIASDCRGL